MNILIIPKNSKPLVRNELPHRTLGWLMNGMPSCKVIVPATRKRRNHHRTATPPGVTGLVSSLWLTMGIEKEKVDPFPGVDSTQISPF